MRRGLFLVFILATLATVGSAQQTVFVPNCVGSAALDTARLTAIKTLVGATNPATIKLPWKADVTKRCKSNTLTLTANITIDNTDGSGISIVTGQTFTPLGPIVNPAGKQLFYNATTGLGTVSFSGNLTLRDVYPEWWGAKGDGLTGSATLNAAAFNAASTALLTNGGYGSGEIKLGPGNYYFNATWNLGQDSNFSGISIGGTNGLVGTFLTWNGATNTNAIYINKGRFNVLHDFMLVNSVAKGTTVGIFVSGIGSGTNVSGCKYRDMVIRGFHRDYQAGEDLGSHAASEQYFDNVNFESADEGVYLSDFNTLNINFTNCSWVANTDYGIHAATGNVTIIGGAAGSNGVDFFSANGLPFTVIGLRTESKKLFIGEGTAAFAAATFINVTQDVVQDINVSGATNATPIEITASAAHGFATGDYVFLNSILGNTAANGPWVITVTSSTKFTLTGSVGNGAYTSGGYGIKDWGAIRTSGHTLTLDNTRLSGMVWMTSYGAVAVRQGSGLFLSPVRIDPISGGGANNPYSIENWAQVDGSNVRVRVVNERGLAVSGSLQPATTATQITANQNNYDPGSSNHVQRWSSDASRNVTGLTFAGISRPDGQSYVVVNVGSQNIVLKHQDALSLPANRFLNVPNSDLTLLPSHSALAVYDATNLYWRVYPFALTSATADAITLGGTLVEGLLAQPVTVNMNTATATSLVTCPSGKTCVITRVVVGTASTSLTTASYSFGWNSASFNNVIADATHTELTGATLYTTLGPKTGATLGASTGTFKVLMNTLQGGAATARMEVFGYVY